MMTLKDKEQVAWASGMLHMQFHRPCSAQISQLQLLHHQSCNKRRMKRAKMLTFC